MPRLSRFLALVLCLAQPALALSPVIDIAEGIQDKDWQLLAINGQRVATEVTATLRIGADGQVTGQAPCNSFGGQTTGTLPEFQLGGIRATKMACDQLAAETAFFAALDQMRAATLMTADNLVMTGPDGQSLEFVPDRSAPDLVCTTCGTE